MNQLPDSRHAQTRATLRTVGPIVAGSGLIFVFIGLSSFFGSFGGLSGHPQYFWTVFLGLPLLAVGLTLCKFAYFGSITRYMANEVAPVGKDVANYMAEGTKGAVRTVAAAVGEGLRSGNVALCAKCQARNESDAKFCKGCGAALTRSCPKCQAVNDADARFCDKCGQSLGG